MKKSNVIIFALLVVISAFFLWLWYFLGFNRVDDPLDLVLSILWWILIIVAVVVIIKLEKVRRRRVRTVYVGEGAAFNSEKGIFSVAPLEDVSAVQGSIAAMLSTLEYDFTREDFPKPENLKVCYFVRTKDFEAKAEADADKKKDNEDLAYRPGQVELTKWTGEVVVAGSDRARSFDTPEELTRILASIV